MAQSFNTLQAEIENAAVGLDGAREGLRDARNQLTDANAALLVRAEKLARSNAELERFAYVASHDLQEPLRTVASFTQLLAQRYEGKNDAAVSEYVGFITTGVSRMRSLIEDLLAYSRVVPEAHELQSVRLEDTLNKALSSLNTALSHTAATVTHDPPPTLQVHGQQITYLFQNFISNAIKFRKPDYPR